MKAIYKFAAPYANDGMSLPVRDIDTAIPYYEKTFGFRVVFRQEKPYRSVILQRDFVRIGLAENGGDASQEGCFFEVDDLDAAFMEIKGKTRPSSEFPVDKFNGIPFRVFFEVAPDGLCYMVGARVK